ncbi:MAG TPA: Asp-tRNA(Asn)/Glu-tRNA(Gln) amidotransferase GatCAB subunit B, partial [Rhodospirillales bacterium]|nr:Asp-tRNA(Asn)/Glu-tRNA(Gln) amidotransferase GatCAB subunit B [Rhodospirillales bacterium]
GETRSMRSKEDAHDYRYFPDPDLLPIDLTPDYVEEIKKNLPELPDAKKVRFISEYGVTESDAGILVAEQETAKYFEEVALGRDAKLAANWVIHELFGVLNKVGKGISDSPIVADKLGNLVDLISNNVISSRIAKDVFEEMVAKGKDPGVIVEEKGLKQITDAGEIEIAVNNVIADNADQVKKFREGNQKLVGWFVGQVMKKTQGKANPQMVNELLLEKLKG